MSSLFSDCNGKLPLPSSNNSDACVWTLCDGVLGSASGLFAGDVCGLSERLCGVWG